ncbi:MAG: endonuclease/exonuclease/phosphatase family protein [Clostridia bacterium]|nr:endonuclease/exonuclease/phosphatase family protein [Clostridia bacterium]
MKLKIMTYNIASGREMGINNDKISVIPMAETIKDYMPDILGLNEVRGENCEFTQQEKEIAAVLGYKYSFFAPAIEINGGGYGNALISKHPIENAKIIEVPDAPDKTPGIPYEQKEDGTYYETRCILKATVLVDDEKLDVFVTHFGLADVEKKNMMDTLTAEFSKSENRKILMGDFNCTPDDEYMKELSDILKNIEPEKVTEDFYTYASYKPDRKIDYIMVDKSFKVGKFGVINSKASDHRPYFAEIEI